MKEQQNFLLILRFRNENVKHVFIDHRQKISADKSKQTSTFLEIIQNSDKPSFETCEVGFWASAYFFKFIDQWAPRSGARATNFYFRGPRISQNIVLGSSLVQ